MIRVALVKNSDLAVPTGHVDSLVGGVIPKIIGMADILDDQDSQLGLFVLASRKAIAPS